MKIKEGKYFGELAIITIKIEDEFDEIPIIVNHKSMRKSITLWAVFYMVVVLQLIPPSKDSEMPRSQIKGRILNCIGLVGY